VEVGGEGGRRVGGVGGASSTVAAAEATAASMVSTASVMVTPSGDAVGEGVASSSSGSEEASDSEEATISGAASSLALDPMTEAPPLPQPFKETSSVPSAGALVSTSAVELMDESRSEHNHERVDAVGEIGRS